VRFRASEVAAATGGLLVGTDVDLDGTGFDSRALRAGQLFVALMAGRDGHDFVASARRAGAPACLVARRVDDGPSIVVTDTMRAFGDLAAHARTRLPDRVVGITGSVGKTSTKDFAAAVLRSGLRTWANERSFNNDQGLPTTICNAPDDTEVLVTEMGMRGLGEIARLCRIARPTIGVVTRVAEAHSELVGGIDGVRRAKQELVEALRSDGVAVLNTDDPRVAGMAGSAGCRVVGFGRHDAPASSWGPAVPATVRIVDLRLDGDARARFRLDTPAGSAAVALAVPGEHMAYNAAAAAAVAVELGIAPDTIAATLGTAGLSAWRMELVTSPSGIRVLNDAYNANTTSMRSALRTLATLTANRRVAVVGVMAEIADAAADHRAIAAEAAALGIELVAVGTDLYGVEPVDDPVAALHDLAGGDAVLVKGSRVAGLERVARAIAER
jgi:UDP-N-acetylmuramoyl-tripeptide--D-alanyl-D-alanine ligase